MYWVKLTQTERKRLNDAYVEQAAQLQLSGREELPRDVKRKVRADVLRMIRAERKARSAKALRRGLKPNGAETYAKKLTI